MPTNDGSAACSSYVDTISARWAAGIACVEVQHHQPGRKRVYLRLELDEARKLADDLAAVIKEREPDA